MILPGLDTELELPEHGVQGAPVQEPCGQGGRFALLELVSEGAVAAPGQPPVKTAGSGLP